MLQIGDWGEETWFSFFLSQGEGKLRKDLTTLAFKTISKEGGGQGTASEPVPTKEGLALTSWLFS